MESGVDVHMGSGAYANSLFWWNLQQHCCRYVELLTDGFCLKNHFMESQGNPPPLNQNDWQSAWMGVQDRANELISLNYGGQGQPSIFKKVAAAAIAIVEKAPIPSTISEVVGHAIEGQFTEFPNSLRAAVAYRYAELALTNAKIKVGKKSVDLTVPIRPSDHYKADILYALAQAGRENRGEAAFSFSFLCFELLAYEANGGFTKIHS